MWEGELQRYVELTDLGEYLAVSEDQQRHLVMSEKGLRQCTPGRFAICPPDVPVHLRPDESCEAMLFRGQEGAIPAVCNRKLYLTTGDTKLYRVATKGSWVFSTPQKILVTLECPGQPQPSILSIQGAGVLTKSAGCHVHAKDFVLYPVTKGYMLFGGRTEYKIPPIPSLLSPEEREKLVTYQQQETQYPGMTTLHEIINSTMHPGTGYAHLRRLLQEADSHYNTWQRDVYSKHVTLGVLIAVSLLVGIGVTIWNYSRLRGCWISESRDIQGGGVSVPITTVSQEPINSATSLTDTSRELHTSTIPSLNFP